MHSYFIGYSLSAVSSCATLITCSGSPMTSSNPCGLRFLNLYEILSEFKVLDGILRVLTISVHLDVALLLLLIIPDPLT